MSKSETWPIHSIAWSRISRFWVLFFKRKKQDGKPTLLGLASLIYSTNQLRISFSFAAPLIFRLFTVAKWPLVWLDKHFFALFCQFPFYFYQKETCLQPLTITCLELSAAQFHVTAVKTQLGKYLGSSPKFQAQFKATWSIIQPHSHDWLSSDWCRIQDRYKGSTLKTHRILDTRIILEKRISQK